MARIAGNVVSIRSFGNGARTSLPAVTQERLRAGGKLLEEQRRVTEALQKFKMDLENDLASGGEIEAGELTFDRELRIVRPSKVRCARILQVLARMRVAHDAGECNQPPPPSQS